MWLCTQSRPGCIQALAVKLQDPPFDLKAEPDLEMRIEHFDPSRQDTVPVAIVGGGPAGIATAARISAQGISVVVVDPSPLRQWPNNYGVWVDEFDALNLTDCLDSTWSQAVIWLEDKRSKCVLIQRVV